MQDLEIGGLSTEFVPKQTPEFSIDGAEDNEASPVKGPRLTES